MLSDHMEERQDTALGPHLLIKGIKVALLLLVTTDEHDVRDESIGLLWGNTGSDEWLGRWHSLGLLSDLSILQFNDDSPPNVDRVLKWVDEELVSLKLDNVLDHDILVGFDVEIWVIDTTLWHLKLVKIDQKLRLGVLISNDVVVVVSPLVLVEIDLSHLGDVVHGQSIQLVILDHEVNLLVNGWEDVSIGHDLGHDVLIEILINLIELQ